MYSYSYIICRLSILSFRHINRIIIHHRIGFWHVPHGAPCVRYTSTVSCRLWLHHNQYRSVRRCGYVIKRFLHEACTWPPPLKRANSGFTLPISAYRFMKTSILLAHFHISSIGFINFIITFPLSIPRPVCCVISPQPDGRQTIFLTNDFYDNTFLPGQLFMKINGSIFLLVV